MVKIMCRSNLLWISMIWILCLMVSDSSEDLFEGIDLTKIVEKAKETFGTDINKHFKDAETEIKKLAEDKKSEIEKEKETIENDINKKIEKEKETIENDINKTFKELRKGESSTVLSSIWLISAMTLAMNLIVFVTI